MAKVRFGKEWFVSPGGSRQQSSEFGGKWCQRCVGAGPVRNGVVSHGGENGAKGCTAIGPVRNGVVSHGGGKVSKGVLRLAQ